MSAASIRTRQEDMRHLIPLHFWSHLPPGLLEMETFMTSCHLQINREEKQMRILVRKFKVSKNWSGLWSW